MATAIVAMLGDAAVRWAGVLPAAAHCLVDALLLGREDAADHGIDTELAGAPPVEREIRKAILK